MKTGRSIAAAVACLGAAGPAAAASPAVPADVPRVLEPWVPWVLHGQEGARCPFLQGKSGDGDDVNVLCSWPSRLALSVADAGGKFTQQWTVFDPRGAYVPLPGDADAWPQDVRVDGAAAVVADHDGEPRVKVPPGTHAVSGAFAWDSQPESLAVPADVGLLSLELRGKAVEFPAWGEDGKLWLQKQVAETPEENRLVVAVERRLDDVIPATVTTRLLVSVSGKAREETVGPVVLPGFTAMAIDSELPVRLEPDGRLRIQVRPGDFTVTLVARSTAPLVSFEEPKVAGPWGDEAIWAFSARNDLRQVSVTGATAVDPQQTRLPDEWKVLPAYRLRPGDALKLVESRRGDPEPAPDSLALARVLWLDFDGKGYTVRDQLSGQMHRGWRLEASPRLGLGRVAISGADQFITRQDPGGPLGVEVRQGNLNLQADARIEGDVDDLPAVGWRHDFRQVSESLNLPPGWRLFHASGVDTVTPTWVKSWTLLDLFAVLITALAVWKLWGLGWGLAALAALVLSYHEPGAPQWLWLAALAVAALGRVLPEGKLKKAAWVVRLGVGGLLAVTLALFVVQQIRQAMYPALESREEGTSGVNLALFGAASVPAAMMAEEAAPAPAAPPPMAQFAPEPSRPGGRQDRFGGPRRMGGGEPAARKEKSDGLMRQMNVPVAGAVGLGGVGGGLANALAKSGSAGWSASSSYSQVADPDAAVQTGPGLTSWAWRTVYLSFSGPVDAAQAIHLYLIPPGLERFLDLLRVALCALLALCILGLPGLPPPRLGRKAAAAAAALLLAGGFAASARAQEVPSEEMLDALRKRLLEKPTCAPDCASLQRLDLAASGDQLRLALEVGAAAETAVPLPGDPKQWRPSQVTLDGRPAPALWRDGDGALWVELPAGAHRVELAGPLPARDSVQIALPLKPHFTVAHLAGWTLQGLRDDGQVEDDLQLSRVVKESEKAGAHDAALQPSDLPPFAEVRRTLQLGLRWNVHTEVTRATPDGSALVLAVPLLPGESVTTADVHVVAGKVQVNLNPGQSSTAWDSVLEQRSPIELAAPTGVPWAERWSLDVSPIWHAVATGIPVIHGQDASGNRLPEWRPWPGEKVSLAITRPAGVPGPTLTIDSSDLTLTPGTRATDGLLDLRLRSSRGGQHELLLPEGAKLSKLVVDDQAQPVHQDGRKVTLAVHPGAEAVELGWTEPHGTPLAYRVPAVGLGAPSVNARTDVNLPHDRWVLFVGGPRLGPAVLFWGVLVALALVAFGLARVGLSPLGAGAWFVLGLGFTQAPLWAGVCFAAWLLLLGLRRKSPVEGRGLFNATQVLIVLWTGVALVALVTAVQSGLLGQPDMQVTGNDSSELYLHWYLDRAGPTLPQPWVVSLPILVYRAAMLAWALWLAVACLRWVRWAWEAFAAGGVWRPASKLAAPRG
ncbi:MAG TPA: hypothetical protein VMB50_22765 [Myxococcales bacterium]|nr:hypothetical protein [Myxococcales bacterium]